MLIHNKIGSIKLMFFIFAILLNLSWIQKDVLFRASNGKIKFVSEAPLELIEAESNELNGILSSENQSFAFSVSIYSFFGFNSPLQKEHYNENYLESEKYPKATFTGSIIDEIDLFTDGVIKARAKGKFTIHGVENTQMIDIVLSITENEIEIKGEFDIELEDYQISIPRIVNKKIAETIHVTVNVKLKKK